MIEKTVRTEIYKGLTLSAFWYKPSDPKAKLFYGYLVLDGDSYTRGTGFRDSVQAMAAARFAADGMLAATAPAKGKYRVKDL